MGHPSPATTAPRASAPLSAPSAPAAAPAQTASKTLPRALLALLLASNLLASINQSMINIALDAVATEFHVELAMANWMVLGFTIVAGTVITTAASLLKRFGLRKIMLCGYVLSLAGGLLGLFSWDFWSMLAARLVQALAVGLFFPVISSAITIVAPKGKTATLLSLNSAVIGAGLAFIPLLSGLFITYVSLRAMFVVPVALSAALLVAGPFVLRDIEGRAKRPIDALSIVLSCGGLALFVYGLNILTKDVAVGIVCMAVGAVVITLFVVRQNRIPTPLLNLAPLRNRAFAAGEALALLGFTGSLYMSLLVPLYLEGTAGRTPFEAGCLLSAPILAYAVATAVGGRIEDRRGIWPLVPVGFAVLAAALVGLEAASSHRLVAIVLVCVALVYIGVGLVFAPLKSRDLGAMPRELVSNASSIHSTLAQVISSVASALFVGIMSSDTVRLMAAGASKADAYAAGFSRTLFIEIGIVLACLAGSVVFARIMHGRWVAKRGRGGVHGR